MPVRLVVLTLALRGRLKVGLDTEQAYQGVVTHTRCGSQRHLPLLRPISALIALCELKCTLNSQTRAD